MNTLTDLKQALDNGQTITDGLAIIYKSTWDGKYFFHGKLVVSEITWDEIKDFVDPSIWRQRDQIGAEKPVMMAVPIEQWDALQSELTELRRFKQDNTGSVWVGEPIGKMKPEEQEMESALFAIFDKNKEAIDNAHYNLMAVGQALVIAKDGSLECERVKFEGGNDEAI